MTKRGYGTGQLYVKHGSYYGRWRTLGDRKLNRRIGRAKSDGDVSGLTRTEAERQFRKLQEAEERRPISHGRERRTVEDVADSLRRRLAVEGARKSYLQNCESMQRVHVSPRLGSKPVDRVTIADVETVAAAMLDAGLAPKTVRKRHHLPALRLRARDRSRMGNPEPRAPREPPEAPTGGRRQPPSFGS